MFSIRPASSDDLSQLAQIWYEHAAIVFAQRPAILAQRAPEHWAAAHAARLDAGETCALFVLVWGTRPAGYVSVHVEAGRPGHRDTQIGVIDEAALDVHGYYPGAMRALVQHARQWLSNRGVTQTIVRVPRSSTVEQAFWRSAGAKDFEQWLILPSSFGPQ
jgi:GNAT superfamily N-acetyltransferase